MYFTNNFLLLSLNRNLVFQEDQKPYFTWKPLLRRSCLHLANVNNIFSLINTPEFTLCIELLYEDLNHEDGEHFQNSFVDNRHC